MTPISCSFPECERIVKAKALCSAHYQQQLKGQELRTLNAKRGRPLVHATQEEFFWARVAKTPGCWLWEGTKTRLGYGHVKFSGTYALAHRYSFELHYGPIKNKHSIDHLCHNPSCVRPDHLREATHKGNMENRKGPHKDSISGIRGVYWNKHHQKWHAEVRHNGVKQHLGYFENIDDANKAAKAKRAELFEVTK